MTKRNIHPITVANILKNAGFSRFIQDPSVSKKFLRPIKEGFYTEKHYGHTDEVRVSFYEASHPGDRGYNKLCEMQKVLEEADLHVDNAKINLIVSFYVPNTPEGMQVKDRNTEDESIEVVAPDGTMIYLRNVARANEMHDRYAIYVNDEFHSDGLRAPANPCPAWSNDPLGSAADAARVIIDSEKVIR